MGDDVVRRIADAVLYEGYLLWPYSKSALKNQQRFTFGGVYPPAWEDRSSMQVQLLLEGSVDAAVEVQVRFLHLVKRQVLRRGSSPSLLEPVEDLEVDGERWVSWEEAVEREIAQGPIRISAGEQIEQVCGGAIRRSWRGLEGEVAVTRELVCPDLSRITVRVANTTPWMGLAREDAKACSDALAREDAPACSDALARGDALAREDAQACGDALARRDALAREDALYQTFCSTHVILRAQNGAWVSLTDPPEALRAEATACENSGVWPVLVGEEGDRSTVLAAPIILSDYPEIAPESPGDLFDSGEIDQLLVLSILAMTDEERRDMRDSDPRAREILERTEALTSEQIMRLHGAVRELAMVRER